MNEAEKIVSRGKVREVSRGNKSVFYEVAGVGIEVRRDLVICTCKHHSINPERGRCVFLEALNIWLKKQGNIA